MLVEVLDEVGLRLQLPLQLLGLHEAERALLALHDLFALHVVMFSINLKLIRHHRLKDTGAQLECGIVRSVRFGNSSCGQKSKAVVAVK